VSNRPEQRIAPQPGPQERFLATAADIAIYGGSAGGGKSFGLLLEPLRHKDTRGFNAALFRRNAVQITNPGGLWDEAEKLYIPLGARPIRHRLTHVFPSGTQIRFSHLEDEKEVYAWQGAQVCYMGYDELTHFSAKQFFYMMSRNRSMCGVRPYIRATTNPDPDSWVADFIAWWIDQNETIDGKPNPRYGYPIKERAGVFRWFIRVNDELIWADTEAELVARHPRSKPKSVTFIPASVYDNRILLETDPGYIANLEALSYVDRMRLLAGNWKIRASTGNVFRRSWFKIVDAVPRERTSTIRYWDRAATEPSPDNPKPDWTVGVKITRDDRGMFFVEHVERIQGTSGTVEQCIKNTASQDGVDVAIGIEQDPGQAGKAEANYHIRQLAQFNIKAFPATKSKLVRAKPASAQAQAGNVFLLRGSWNEAFLAELEAFPDGLDDDQVDGFSGGLNALADTSPSAVRLVKSKDPNRTPIDMRARRGRGLL
jgi:predicted phage terminase large subunit-like protein